MSVSFLFGSRPKEQGILDRGRDNSLDYFRGLTKGWFWRMFPQNENRNEGTFGCSPRTKTGTRVRSHVPPELKPERGYIRENHPFTKPPVCLPMIFIRLEFSLPYQTSKTNCKQGNIIHWRKFTKSSGDGTQDLQTPVACHDPECPETKDTPLCTSLELTGHYSLLSVHVSFPLLFFLEFTVFIRKENAKFTQSLLCLLFTKFASWMWSLAWTINIYSKWFWRILLHSLICWWLPTQAQFIENNKQIRDVGLIAMWGFIPIIYHTNVHYSLSSLHKEWFTEVRVEATLHKNSTML